MRKIIFALVAVVISCGSLSAQKKGKPKLKLYKTTEKKAKKGDVPAMLKIASVCQGNFLEKDEFRNFKLAEEWYAKIPADQDIENLVPLNRFILFLNGGFGIEPAAEKANTYFEEAVNRSDLSRIYDDQINLHLRDFYVLKQDAETNPDKKLLLARHYFEFEISYNKAIALLNDLINTNKHTEDARFYKELWHAQLKRYRSYGKTKLPELIYFGILEKHSEKGSGAAALLWVKAAENASYSDYKLNSEKCVQILSGFSAPNPEVEFKQLCLLQKYQKGMPRFISLRRAAGLAHGLDQEGSAFAKEMMDAFREFDTQINTLSGLEKFAEKRENIKLHLDFKALRIGFGNKASNLADFSRRLQNKELRQMAGPTNFKNYEEEVFGALKKMPARAAGNPISLMEIGEFLSKNAHFRDRAKALKIEIDTLLADAGLNAMNRSVYEEMYRFSKKKLRNFGEGFDAYRPVFSRKSRESEVAAAEQIFIKYIREKTILDVIGEHPGPAEIEVARPRLLNTHWLQPVGEEVYFRYLSDSKNSFSGKIMRGGKLYYYKIKRNSSSHDYKMDVYTVQGKNNFLVYSSVVKAAESAAGVHEFVVKVYGSEYRTYHWEPSETDYLQINYPAGGDQISSRATGRLNRLADNTHGLSAEVLNAKAGPGDYSEKTAIRSAVRCFILEYNRAMK